MKKAVYLKANGVLIFSTEKAYEDFKPAAFCRDEFNLKSAEIVSGPSHNRNNYSCDVTGVDQNDNEREFTIIVRKRRFSAWRHSWYTSGTLTQH